MLVSAHGATLDTWRQVVHTFMIMDVVGIALTGKQLSVSAGVLRCSQLLRQDAATYRKDPHHPRALTPLPICLKQTRKDVPPDTGNADFGDAGLAWSGDSNGDSLIETDSNGNWF